MKLVDATPHGSIAGPRALAGQGGLPRRDRRHGRDLVGDHHVDKGRVARLLERRERLRELLQRGSRGLGDLLAGVRGCIGVSGAWACQPNRLIGENGHELKATAERFDIVA